MLSRTQAGVGGEGVGEEKVLLGQDMEGDDGGGSVSLSIDAIEPNTVVYREKCTLRMKCM